MIWNVKIILKKKPIKKEKREKQGKNPISFTFSHTQGLVLDLSLFNGFIIIYMGHVQIFKNESNKCLKAY